MERFKFNLIPQWIFKNLNDEIPVLLKEQIKEIETQGESCGFILDKSCKDIEKTGNEFKRNDLSIYAIHCGNRYSLSSPDLDCRKLALQETRDLIVKANILNAKVLVTHTGICERYAGEKNDEYSLFTESLKELQSDLEASHLMLAVENVKDDYQRILTILQDLDSPFVRACFDIGHARIAGKMWDGLNLLFPYIGHIHIHDNNGTQDQHLPPGHGSIDWKRFLTILEMANYRNLMTVEAIPEKHDTHKDMLDKTNSFFYPLSN